MGYSQHSNLEYPRGTQAVKPVPIRFEEDLLARLQSQAEAKGVSLANLVRSVMENWLDGKYQYKSTIDTKPGS